MTKAKDTNTKQIAPWITKAQESTVKAFAPRQSDGFTESPGLDAHRLDIIGTVPRNGKNTILNLSPRLVEKLKTCGTGSDNSKINALIDYAFHVLERDGKRLTVDTSKRFPKP